MASGAPILVDREDGVVDEGLMLLLVGAVLAASVVVALGAVGNGPDVLSILIPFGGSCRTTSQV